MTKEEFLIRMYDYADTRRANDPTYGQLDKTYFAHLSPEEMELAYLVIDEFREDGESFQGQPTVDVGSFKDDIDRLGVTLDDLVKKGVSEATTTPGSVLLKENNCFVLTGKIAMHLFEQRYPVTDTKDQVG